MRSSCSTITWQSVTTNESFAEILNSIKNIGYEGVEIEYRLLPPSLKENPDMMLDLVRGAGLEVSSISLVDTSSVLDFITGAGVRRTTLCLFEKDFETAKLKTRSLLEKLPGVEIAAHPHIRSSLETEAQLEALMEACKPFRLKLCFDTAHTVALGIEPISYLHRFGGILSHVHIKDLKSRKSAAAVDVENDFVDLNEGIVDLKSIVKTLKEMNYKGWISVEVDYPYHETAEISASKNYKRLKTLLNDSSSGSIS